MALIVETGAGDPLAESFNTIAEVGDYATKFGLSWTGSDAEKEVAARQGTQYLEAKYGRSLSGTRQVIGQALSWPRSGAEDSEAEVYADGLGSTNVYVTQNTVPQPWKDAHSEMSIRARSEILIPDLANPGTVTSKSVTVGPISKSTTWDSGNSPIKYFRKVHLMVLRYLSSADSMVRA